MNDNPVSSVTIHKNPLPSQKLQNGLQENKGHRKMQDNQMKYVRRYQEDNQRRLRRAIAQMAV
jgi:hypothetical protein